MSGFASLGFEPVSSEPTRVLIAEDEALIRLDLKEMLEEEGYAVVAEVADGQQAVDRAQALRQTLEAGGLRAPVLERIRDEIWLKLWGNLCFNPISALTHATLEAICGDPGTRAVARAIMLEAKAIVMRRAGQNRRADAFLQGLLAERPDEAWVHHQLGVTVSDYDRPRANQHLRRMMVFLNVPMLQQPEAYIGGAASLFDEQGNLTGASTREFLGKFMQAFADWIDRVARN